MNSHSTNYFKTLIEVAEDCPVNTGEIPPEKGEKKSIANLQYEFIGRSPYKYTSDELLFRIHSLRKELADEKEEAEKEQFFSKGQACMRSSPLAKRYGWGIHFDSEGKIALFACDSKEYANIQKDDEVKKVKAMRSKRAG